MAPSVSLTPSPRSRSAEVIFFQHHRFQSLKEQAQCSASSIVRLACAICLQAFSPSDSICLVFQGKEKAWQLWSKCIDRGDRVLPLLQGELDTPQTTQFAGDDIFRHALSVSSLEEDLQKFENEPSLASLKGVFQDVEVLFAANWDHFTRGIILRCEYTVSCLSDWQARCILSTFRQVLENLVSRPYSRVSDIELMNDRDYQQCLDWNQRPPDHVDINVSEMIDKRIRNSPLGPAVDAWDGLMSYTELDAASSRVAQELRERGVGPESTVALFFDKSMWNIVATVAVLKAGGAFVPLDPSQPDNRISSILDQIQAKVVMCSEVYTQHLLHFSQEVFGLGNSWGDKAPTLISRSDSTVRPWNLAYIMFTSGSTGEPKGVMIDHAACASSVMAHGQATGFNRNTRTLQYARHTFDASIAEILTTLAFGGCVVIPSTDERLDNITAVIQEKRVNWAFFTPSVIRLLDPFEVPGLTTVVIGGEPLGQDNIETWAAGRNLIHAYGPTENTVFSTMHPLSLSSKAGAIGRGVGTLCWITDPEDPNRLSPLGAAGELLLESPQLARGYLNFADNEGPNQAFVQDPPWLAKHGRRSRLYKTGDLCRFDENGVIHFEGRKDTQLKISGQRLEASEVEYHLRAAFRTPDIVVDVLNRPTQDTKAQSKVLVAFVCLGTEANQRPNDMSKYIMTRRHPPLLEAIPGVEEAISQKLPSWMRPSIYIPLTGFPLSPNGKADVKRLRREAASLTVEQFYLFAQTDSFIQIEETPQLRLMRDLWAEVLGIQSVAILASSSFFRLGGDSLAAISLVTAARRKGLQLSVAQIFKSPSLHDLCRLATEFKKTTVEIRPFELVHKDSLEDVLEEISYECAIGTEDVEDAFPCTPLQEGLMALSSSTSNSYLVQYVLDLAVDIDIARLKMAWEAVAETHGMLRVRMVDTFSSGILQVIVRENVSWNESFNLEEYLEMDLNAPSTFGMPLNRFGIVYAANGDACHMVWTVHHAVTDGQAVGLTFQSVRDAFHGALKPAESSFASFMKHFKDMHMESASRYWSSVFEGAEFESFPRKPPAVHGALEHQGPAFARRQVPVPSSSTDATTTTMLRAAWGLVISHFSNSDDVVFGVTSSGRNAPFDNIEAILGPIIATVPLRIRCNGTSTVRDLLDSVQMSTINMIPFEQMGIQNIARINSSCRSACDFQTMMIVQPEVDMAMTGGPFVGFHRPQDLDKFRSHAVMFECNLGQHEVFLNVNYDPRYIEPLHMERLVDYFESALEFLASSEHQVLDNFFGRPLARDLADMSKWNQHPTQTIDSCVHAIFEEHVRTQPDSQAVFAWDGLLAFSQLDTMASRLARVLMELGVGPEKMVPYCFEKSIYTIVSMLAILKAGGAMVPLDPAHPPDRKAFIVNNTMAKVVVVSSANADLFSGLDVHIVVVDSNFFAKVEEVGVATFSNHDVQPCNAATVIFTSGSTGQPKGVVQEHKTLCSAAIAHSDGMHMSKTSRILQFSSHVFDVSIIEIINSFVLGACICVPSDEERMSNLAGFVSRSQANWAFFTPSFARTLEPKDLPSMKTICMGGEAMTMDCIETWSGIVQLINAYGPCEGSVCTTADISSGGFKPNSIGYGANTLTWIVNPSNHDILAPIGSVGELLIEGPSLARGYLGDVDKTTKSFITNPAWIFQIEAGSTLRRMYKTGDLGILNSDGSISYVGRKDTQIKLRGQRVEPGEVEHQLAQLLPSGSIVAVDAIVLSGSSSKSLVAFIQLENHGFGFAEKRDIIEGLDDRLKQQLASVLPAYMVPSHLIPVENIPFTPTGKLDRRTLKEYASALSITDKPGSGIVEEDANMLAASEHIALGISNKLAQLLSVGDPRRAKVLRGHNFNPYYAGMDSIQVISLSTFVRKSYNVSIPIQKYMNSATTVRDIAQLVIEDQQGSYDDTNIDLVQEIEVHDQILAASLLPRSHAVVEIIHAPQIILLTGATGFLGNQLLAQILQLPQTRSVVVLVRGQHPAHATERLLSLARGSSWWQEEYVNRIEVWHGDLSLPHLGLPEALWSRLDGTSIDGDLIDAVVHNGAVVNWMADFQALTPANVLSTVNILAALTKATASRSVRLTYVSGGHLSTSPDNVEEIAVELKSYPAYSQTKFVAEILVARYAERLTRAGFSCLATIVKPGLIMGSSSDGISNTDDFLWRLTASALDMGMFNDSERDLWLAAAGVDLVANIVLDSCFYHESSEDCPAVKKVLNGLTMGEYWDIVKEETGRAMEPIDSKHWLRSLHGEVEAKGPSHRLWPVLHFVEDTGGKLGQPLGAMSNENQLEYKDSVTTSLRKSLRYLIAIGYMQTSRRSSVDGDSSSEPTLPVPRPMVFSRTPTTPVWTQTSTDQKRLGYGNEGGVKLAGTVVVAPLRTPSPSSDFVPIE
ncbi:non-ribosomal peptide synthetase [Colletotrichum godetiae]|uniref:Non-ribosomal peptide synthetase n=1 Tax=Colletotrichum godetiae TaxID=1209918 RepID=A0AAJ0AEL3_9PEZI|nr:non-ribosomal peptide synthetase [Colletotrichum godetiae]KAK1659545.1 non-ribosomal peptide synthetase [Colletotrichum godetiae]